MFDHIGSRLNESSGLGYHSGGAEFADSSADFANRTQEGSSDMDVRGLGSVHRAYPVRSVSPSSGGLESTPASRPTSPTDALEISSAGKMLDQLSQTTDMRQERIARIKEAIENGTYDTDAKLEAALERMLGSLGIDLDDE